MRKYKLHFSIYQVGDVIVEVWANSWDAAATLGESMRTHTLSFSYPEEVLA